MKMWSLILSAWMLAAFAVSADAIADQAMSGDKTADAIIASYRGPEVMDARELAEADHRYAVGQRDRARAAVGELLGEIKIEGAEDVEIGGEIRAARLNEAAWQRAVETVADYIARLDSRIAGR